jgi:ABC-type uncharacterized transport system substrate-binding protein
VRSSRESCQPSVIWVRARWRSKANGSPLWYSGCGNWAGRRAAPSRSSIAGGEGRSERAAEIAAEFVRLKVDVIVTSGTPQVIAARQATSLIPIVFASAGDPVGGGLVASLARPGGNVTGLSSQMTDTAAKRLEFLREVVPSLRRLTIMVNVSNPLAVLEMVEAQAAVRTLGLDAAALEIRRADDIAMRNSTRFVPKR